MGCVKNVFDHQQYFISCLEACFSELRRYRLTKVERDYLETVLFRLYQFCKKHRDRAALVQQMKINKVVAEMTTPRVYDCEDDLPF